MTADASGLQQQLWDFVYAYDAAYERAAQAAGLTAAQACLLRCASRGGASMGELAAELLCDASNVTHLVKRLEADGLVTRAPDPADRRTRRVTVTSAGLRRSREAEAAFTFPRDRAALLDAGEREALATLLRRMSAAADTPR